MILVIGATGTNGREVVQRLAGAGHRVRALVRNPAKADGLRLANIELAQGDLDDPASLDRAFGGVSRAFVVTAVDQRAVGWFRNAFDAAKRAGTPHVVKFSGLGAGVADSELLRQHAESDAMLQSSGLPYTMLRPNSFFQNMLWSAGTIKEHGAFYLPMRDGRQSLVDVRDIAAVAVKVLTEQGHEGQVYEITGPESLSYADVAATLSWVRGKPVKYVDVPPEAARESMLKAGMPKWNAEAVTELYGAFATGQFGYTTDTVERITGQPPISLSGSPGRTPPRSPDRTRAARSGWMAHHYRSGAMTVLGFRHDGDAGTARFQLHQQFARLGPDRTAARRPKATRGTAEVGKSGHHAVLHGVSAQLQNLAVEVGGDDEHARQVGVSTRSAACWGWAALPMSAHTATAATWLLTRMSGLRSPG